MIKSEFYILLFLDNKKFISYDSILEMNLKNYNNIEFIYEDSNLNIHNEKTKKSNEIDFNFYNKNQFVLK